METGLLLIRLLLFGVFAVAGMAKLLDRDGAENALKDFGMPKALAGFFALALPVLELLLAASFLPVQTYWYGAAAALVLLMGFSVGMIWQMMRGRAPDCHCFGQLHSEPVSVRSIVRNLVLATLAAILLGAGTFGTGISIATTAAEWVSIGGMLSVLAISILILGYVAKIFKKQAEIERRLGLIEPFGLDGLPVERNEAGDPSDGLPIGAPLPSFDLLRVDGSKAPVAEILDTAKPALFLFVGPNCAPCEGLLPEIEEWERELSERVQFVFISHGRLEENRAKFEKGGRAIFIDEDRALAMAVNAKWTPTALFVDLNGNIASHIAAGDVAIRRLIEQMKLRDLTDKFVYFLGLNGQRRPNIGESIPEFSLKDITGKELTKNYLIGRRTVVAFSSTSCGHCARLMKQIRDWEANRSDEDPQMLIFTDGEPEQEIKLGLSSPMVSERDYRTASRFGMRGVPSAVVVDESGTIITEAAIGPENIWALIGQKPSGN